METKTRKILSVFILVVIIAIAVIYFAKNVQEFKQLKLENFWLLIPIGIIFLVNYFLIGLTNVYLLQPMKVHLRIFEGFQLAIVNGFYNLITPLRGGMAVKAVYLKKKHNFPYTNFLASVAASYILIFLVAGLIGLFSSYFIYASTNSLNWLIFVIFSLTTIIMLGVVIFSPKFPETRYLWLSRFIRILNGWHLIRKERKTVLFISLLSLVQLLLGALGTYLSFRVFGLEIPYISALFLVAIGSLGIIIALTPAGLGIQEAIIVFSALAIGISAAESLPVALLGRAVSLIVLFILGLIFSYTLLKREK